MVFHSRGRSRVLTNYHHVMQCRKRLSRVFLLRYHPEMCCDTVDSENKGHFNEAGLFIVQSTGEIPIIGIIGRGVSPTFLPCSTDCVSSGDLVHDSCLEFGEKRYGFLAST